VIIKLNEEPKNITFRDRPEDGRPEENRFNGKTEFRHSIYCEGEDYLMYLPMDAQKMIEEMGVFKGDTITIAKLKRAGSKGAWDISKPLNENTHWRNNRDNAKYVDPDDYRPAPSAWMRDTRQADLEEPPPPRQPPARHAQAMRQQETLASHITQSARPPVQPIAPAASQGANALDTQIANAAATMDISKPTAKLMAVALYCAIDAYAAAADYAARKGLDMQFGPRDITSFAISSFINQTKGSRA
jgi:hypothetical protein